MSLDSRQQPDTRFTGRSGAGPPPELASPPPDGGRSQLLDQVRGFAAPLWADWRLGAAVAAGLAATWGLLAGWWMPRGPLTTGQALASLALSLAVGCAAGFVSRSRWAMPGAAVVFAVVFELVRASTDGPTVDGLHTSTYGLLALAVGRGFHGLVALVPLVLGAAIGAGTARHLSASGLRSNWLSRYARRGVAVLTAVALLGLSIGLARPARTDPITGPDGSRLPNSIAELSTIDVNGRNLAVMIRGHDINQPVLLFLAGGPGGSELGAMRRHLPGLEEHFVVATWDQRGTGKSYATLDPTATYTLSSAVDDTIAVTNHLRDRFGQEQIYLLGQSWGTILGVLAVQQQPQLYRAFIGAGQMVSPQATDRIFYDDTLAWARDNDNTELVDDLSKIGPPPYADMLAYETALSYEHQVYPYDHRPNSEGEGGFSENFLVEEYALIDQVHLLAGFMDTFSVVYPQIQKIDLRTQVPRLEVPVYFAQGAHEAGGRAVLFEEWYQALDAPTKELAVFSTSGHRPLFEQPDQFVELMTGTVLADTTR